MPTATKKGRLDGIESLAPHQFADIANRALVRTLLADYLPKSTTKSAGLRLGAFVRAAWRIIEPGTELSWNWHMDDICDHLEAITYGYLRRYEDYEPRAGYPALDEAIYQQLRNLLINVPPRSSKSTIISVMWPAWAWGEVEPALRFLYSSYSMGLATDHSVYTRTVIESDWYQKRYAAKYQLRDDANEKRVFANDKGGKRQAVSVGSQTTGLGGDFLVADDPHNAIEAESDVGRMGVERWYRQAFSTRLNNPKRGAKVIVMQRLHVDDLSGILMRQDVPARWERLVYRQEYEPSTDESGEVVAPYRTCLGYADRRTETGALLWEARFSADVLRAAQIELGSYGYAGQHQQRPTPLGGGMLKLSWWQYYRRAPNIHKYGIFIDTAYTEDERNDYSVLGLAGITNRMEIYMFDVWRERMEMPELVKAVHLFWRKWYKRAPGAQIVIEEKASGKSLVQLLRRGGFDQQGKPLPRLPAVGYKLPHGQDKVARAIVASPYLEAGQIYLPENAAWAGDFVRELAEFPAAPHDDQVDMWSMMVSYLMASMGKRLYANSGS